MPQPRGKTRKVNKNKSRKQGNALTIPQLRSSLEYITNYTENLVRSKNASVKEIASLFAAEWKKVFGKKLSTKVAESYIKSMMKVKKGTRKMRGGNHTLAGAPLDYKTGPGLDLPYGKYPAYVSGGFVNPEPGILGSCGIQKGVLPYADTGSNKMSGGSLFFRPFTAQSPETSQHSMMTSIKGLPQHPGPESWQTTWNYRTLPFTTTYSPSINDLNRTIAKDTVVPYTLPSK